MSKNKTLSDAKSRVVSSYERERLLYDQHKCWVVRSRCKMDDQGRLISANYSVVHNIKFSCDKGSVGSFCVMGAFNPVPNDTNLEPK